MPIARPKKRGAQKAFETEWTLDRITETTQVNRIRERVDQWRAGGYVSITSTTRRLLEYWNDSERERRLFFCQREAVETAIYITEVASKYGDPWIQNFLNERNAEHNAALPRIAMKMATGSGKTLIMAMLIAWQALNKLDNRQDARFSNAFLIITPGITNRDRLRVLLPSNPGNYYRALDVLPSDLRERLGQARITIVNYHAFLLRERGDAARLTKNILAGGQPAEESPFKETPAQMVRRVARDLEGKKNLVVINDDHLPARNRLIRRKPRNSVGGSTSIPTSCRQRGRSCWPGMRWSWRSSRRRRKSGGDSETPFGFAARQTAQSTRGNCDGPCCAGIIREAGK